MRRLAPIALVAAGAVLLAVLLGLGGGSYELHAHFADASQLVSGGSVRIAGRHVGSISSIDLTPDGQADVVLSLDGAVHAGTRASIRAFSQAGVANRYVELSPGPASAVELRSGSVLDQSQTQSMVNLDAILDSFGPAQRANLQGLIANSASVYAGSGSRVFNEMLGKLDPALRSLGGLTTQLGDDRAALRQVIGAGATAASAIASRRQDLSAAVANTAISLGAIARERVPLAAIFQRAPGVLAQARGTLAAAATAVTTLRPTLRAVVPVAHPLSSFLRQLDVTLPRSKKVLAQLDPVLPDLRAGLAGLPQLNQSADPALQSAATALDVARPITRAARLYGSDLLLGVFQGLAGVATANYDAWGHYARLEFTQPPQSALGGPLASLFTSGPLVPGLFDLRTRLLRRCPGGNTPPAIDGSSPWLVDTSICSPSNDVSPDVNFP